MKNKYLVNGKQTSYTLFMTHLKKSIMTQLNNYTNIKLINDLYFNYYNEMKNCGCTCEFKDKMIYQVITQLA